MHNQRLARSIISHRQRPFSTPIQPHRTKRVPRYKQAVHQTIALQIANDRYHPERKDHIRAIAEAAAKRLPESTRRIPRFSDVVRTYCEMVLSDRGRFVVMEYFVKRLKQIIPPGMREKWRMRAQWTKKALDGVKVYLRGLAAKIIQGLEERILRLVTGAHPRTKRELPRNRFAMRSRLSEGTRKYCVVITEGGDLVDLQAQGDFKRRQRRRFRGERYVRPNPGLRHAFRGVD